MCFFFKVTNKNCKVVREIKNNYKMFKRIIVRNKLYKIVKTIKLVMKRAVKRQRDTYLPGVEAMA